MNIGQQVYHFLFHPLREDHSLREKINAITAVIALSILSLGIFLIPFGIIQWKDRDVTVKKKPTRTSNVARPIISKKPSNIRSSIVKTSKAKTVKTKQAWQLAKFEQWAAEGDWASIHKAHYDWWMFPNNRTSAGEGPKYQVSQKDINALKSDPEFMGNYRRGVELVARAWGWEVIENKPVENPSKHQKWQNWPVRLGKMADSLRLFGENTLRSSMRDYAQQAGLRLPHWVQKMLKLP